MEEKIPLQENNQVTVAGKVAREFRFSHEYYGEGFYRTDLLVRRLNDSRDSIPLIVSDRLLDMSEKYAGRCIDVKGQFRSYNARESEGRRMQLSVFARELQLLEQAKDKNEDQIFIEGYVSKPTVHRITPLGREITEVVVAVNRAYGRCDYIPCICWGRNAKFARGFVPGDRILVWGRIQSRDYIKHLEDHSREKRTTYEVSVTRLTRRSDRHTTAGA